MKKIFRKLAVLALACPLVLAAAAATMTHSVLSM